MATLQAFLLLHPSLSGFSSSSSSSSSSCSHSSSFCKSFRFYRPVSYFKHNPRQLHNLYLASPPPGFRDFGFSPRPLLVSCTFHQDNVNLDKESSSFHGHPVPESNELKPNEVNSGSSSLCGDGSVSDVEVLKTNGFSESSEIEVKNEFAELGLDSGEVDREEKGENVVEGEEKTGTLLGKEGEKSRIPLMVFLMGVWASAKRGFEKMLMMDWLSWWPFWRQEKRLERLIVEADANPKDPAKQSALLSELNKHSPESVMKRFEQRDHAVDSKGVAEYLRALVVTNAIAEYLPDEESGKPSSLPSLLQELKQRASGNVDEPFLNPGINEKQPLHVLMVEPKASNKSRFAQELVSTVLFTVAVGLVWIMGAAALQKYIGSLGGIGTSGVGSSSSYSPKELNKEVTPEKNVKTFKDVKGCDDAKQELEEVVEYLKNPGKFTRLGGKLPKGILLTGAPGTGKTLLAKAIAGEAGVPFFYRAGSEFEEMFVGVGARRVRSLFQAAKKKAPCIIFIDEIDAVGSTRKQWEGHTKKTLHQLLVEMDGFEQNEGIILMAATNLPDILDPALTRPGRFDRHIVVPNPDVRGRQEILELYLQDKPMAEDVDVKAIARGTPGFNGADLANLVNIAAIKAAVEGADKLTAGQLEFAKDRIIMGTERKTMFISEECKKLTAYHESGHAIVAFNTEGAYPIHKATIMPRGSALGMVTQLPSNDETSVSKKQLLARLDVCMGGRVAEELIFGQDQVTTGASSDLHTATEIAQYMVSSCGMSNAIGPVHIKDRPSSEMQSRIDAEVVKLLREAYDRVKALLKKHEKALHALANALLEYETLSAEEIKRLLLPQGEGGRLLEQQEEQQQEEGDLVLSLTDSGKKKKMVEAEEREQEAQRLKSLAEAKFEDSNLKSALRYAKRAQRLCPKLDGLEAMVTSFKVLRTGSDSTNPDWYGVLEVEPFSHINTIKKQYKRLAFLLHPDKTPMWDEKMKENEELVVAGTFWTACSRCRLLHQFDKRYLGHILVCPSCRKSFEAVEVEKDEGGGEEDGNFRVRARSERLRNLRGDVKICDLRTKPDMGSVGLGSGKEKAKRDIGSGDSEREMGGDGLWSGGRLRSRGLRKRTLKVQQEKMKLKLKLKEKERDEREKKQKQKKKLHRQGDSKWNKDLEAKRRSVSRKTKELELERSEALETNGSLERRRKSNNRNLEIMTVEDSDFYDFDRDRVERSFKKGQVWAIYDDDDGMPRHYGLIDEVISVNPFEVKLSWLDLQSNRDEVMVSLEKMGFHISCGRFKVSKKTEIINSVNIFSHVVDCERAAREVYRIYPKKGSVWALYNESALDAEGRNVSGRDKRCYDIVVFLTTYSEMHGLSMAYLEKVDGFKTVFKRSEIGPHAIRWLEKDDVGLFSHQIPARKLSGEEAADISKDCWELDPASLPSDLLAIGHQR
ncbi:hypothetical protein FNV43_RR09589 [Rhamnella rubrinervis]|uniref:J domain-containing protein n=1 Tax=Rhamnella rubrinervis TaxID=2594499 RepID=A0A8K0HBL9_9ROSA|nr:hypothetical protein FNV43_RR09589 [Rhamnella rubrinervis]